MAGRSRIAGITIEIGGDTTKLQKALSGVNKTISRTQSQLRDINKLLKVDPGNTELLRQKQSQLANEIAATNEKLRQEKEALRLAAEQDLPDEEQAKLRREVIATEQDLKALKKEMKSFGSVSKQQLTAIGNKFKAVGDKVSSIGQSLLPISGILAALGFGVVKTTSDFDSSMSQVAAVSGATGEEFDQLRNKAREMGEKTKFSASESADAMNYMAMAGWKTGDMLDGIEGIMNLAAASGEDLATTSDIVTDALTAFGMTAADSGRFADVLAAASANANTNVGMLGESFKYVAPVAGALGYSAEDTSIALGLMANSGIKASQGGTALRTVLTNMANPTDKMSAAMEQLGVSLTDEEGNMLSLREIMGQLREGFSGLKDMTDEQKAALAELDSQLEDGTLSEEEYAEAVEKLVGSADDATGATKAQTAAMLAGKTGMSGLLAIVNASDEDFNKLAEAIDGSSGSAEDMANTMQDNLAGQMQILMSQLQELAISLGDSLMPTIRDAVAWVQQLVDKFNNLSPSTKKVIAIIGAIVAVAAPLLMAIGGIVSGVGGIITIVGALTPVISGIAAMIPFITAMAAPLAAAFLPIIGIIAGIIGAIIAVILVIKNWGKITQWLKKVWSKVSTFLQDTWDSIKEYALAIFKALKLAITLPIRAARKIIKTVWENLSTWLSEKWDAIKETASTVFQAIKKVVTAPIQAAKRIIKAATEKISGFFDIFESVKETVSSVFETIGNAISDPIGTARDLVSDAIDTIKGLFPLSIGKIFSNIKLPHFSVTGGEAPYGLFGMGKRPSIDVEWYAKAMKNGMILNNPTIFGAMNGNLLGAGEAGAEAIVGARSLSSMIQQSVTAAMTSMSSTIAMATYKAVSAAMEGGRPLEATLYMFKNSPQMGKWVVETYDTYKPRLG